MESKSYIRLSVEGEFQGVRVEPYAKDHNRIAVYLDEEEDDPMIMSPESAILMLMASHCVPLELVTHGKHKNIH